ncbi:hypothetical protein Sango_3049800 [Sesamum angolense]|uniref:Uncharacterized protein n=1 Tax=Sesamum angolense TaxID=2727404 RepID=A0AAE1T9U1_9LAMI|nr:hypothetical protein Sango_3049800 [Sesamum angolense]
MGGYEKMNWDQSMVYNTVGPQFFLTHQEPEAADQPLYSGCDQSQLAAVARLVNIKAEHNMSERYYDQVFEWASDLLHRDHTLPSNYYNTKKMIRDLGLPVEKIHRLYASPATAEHMTWHASHVTGEDSMCHPSNAEAWRHFDRTHPDFALEPRNIRLGL